ncbi:MAG: DsbE family thiol:disulfide interchange protein [Neisseriaceae bacterium]|nr:DsbE family thiol:disulfide interchange protein [Neisseriaceae bacterium]
MKRFVPFLMVLILLVLLGLGLTRDPGALPSALINQPVPEFSLPSLSEPDVWVQAADLTGKPWVLNVWASWCNACVAEHSVLLKWQAQQPDLRLIGLNYKDEASAAKAWLAQVGGNPYEQILTDQEGRLGIDLGIYGVPETFIISADNRILYRFAGALTDEDIQQTLMPLLSEGAHHAVSP